MSDKINSFTLVMSYDISEERADQIKELILGIRGVVGLSKNVADHAAAVGELRAFNRIHDALWEALRKERDHA